LILAGVAAVVWSAVPIQDWAACAVAAGRGSNPLAFAVTAEGFAATVRYLPLAALCLVTAAAAVNHLMSHVDEPGDETPV
jgi:hypothetical protein